MFPYENVMSIHSQKMAQYQNERNRKQLKEIVRAGRPSPLKRLGDAAGDILTSVFGRLQRARPVL